MIRSSLIIICLLLISKSAHAQTGILDSSFGSNGTVKTDISVSKNFDELSSMAVQTDGKIVACGYTSHGFSGQDKDIVVVRYKSNGSLDSAFGTNGQTYTAISAGGDDYGNSVLLQSDGKIVVTGYTSTQPSDLDFVAVRYLANGKIDSGYGTNGIVVTALTPSLDVTYSSVIQPDNKVIICGTIPNGTGGDMGAVRYKTDGSLDSTFGVNGLALYSDTISDVCIGAAIQADGKIILGGYAGSVSNYDFGMVRLKSDGTPDNTFGTAGKVQVAIGNKEDIGQKIAIQSNGKIILAGYAWNDSMTKTNFAMARFSATGTLDATFGTGGKVITTVNTGVHDYGRALALQPDGKIIVGGSTYDPPNSDFAILRYLPNGTADTSFAPAGKIVRDVSDSSMNDWLYACVMQPDGKLLVGGSSTKYGMTADDLNFTLQRYFVYAPQNVEDTKANISALSVFPNPLTAGASLQYTLRQADEVSVSITDMQGKIVQLIFENKKQAAGTYSQQFTMTKNLPSGQYFLLIATKQGRNTATAIVKQ